MKSPFSTEEENELRIQLSKELQEQHKSRLERFKQKKQSAKERGQEHKTAKRDIVVAEIRREMEIEFFKSNGYKRYVDSRGRVQWLTPEEYDWKMKIKKHKKTNFLQRIVSFLGLSKKTNREYDPGIMATPLWNVLLYGGLILFAIAIGLLLVIKGN